jgi:importin subunit beta-1
MAEGTSSKIIYAIKPFTSLPALEKNFSPYINAFLPFLGTALKAHDDTALCSVAIGVIGDLSRALGEQSAQYAPHFMSVLLENLQDESLNRNVKVPILSCFGDIALAIGPAFEPYLDTTMGVLRQAGGITPNPVSLKVFVVVSHSPNVHPQLDYELVDYVATLREGILEAYTGIVTGLKNTDKG